MYWSCVFKASIARPTFNRCYHLMRKIPSRGTGNVDEHYLWPGQMMPGKTLVTTIATVSSVMMTVSPQAR